MSNWIKNLFGLLSRDYTSWQATIGSVPQGMDMEAMVTRLKTSKSASYGGWTCTIDNIYYLIWLSG